MVAYARPVAESTVPEKACGLIGSLAAGQLLGRGAELSEESRALPAQWGLVTAVSGEQAADVVGVQAPAEAIAAGALVEDVRE